MALRGPVDESLDSYVSARAGAIRIAEFVNVMIGANTKR
jgi:hypothetical protein